MKLNRSTVGKIMSFYINKEINYNYRKKYCYDFYEVMSV